MQHTSTKRLYEYWDHLRGDRFAPNRFEIEPAQLADILPDIFILECADLSSYLFRLAGTRICTALGHELRRQNLLDYWNFKDREGLQSLLHTAASDGAGILIECMGRNATTREQAHFEMLILPLLHTNNMVNRMLGSISPLTDNSWAGRHEIRNLTLETFEIIWPDLRPPLPSAAEPPVMIGDGVPGANGTRSRFRVLEGGLSTRPHTHE